MSLRTPLGRVRGLGSAKEGTAHWWAQRLTAIALVPLVLWFAVSLIVLAGADHATVAAWLRDPVAAVLMLLLILAGFHHAQLGMQVVIEDYVHSEVAQARPGDGGQVRRRRARDRRRVLGPQDRARRLNR